MKAKKDLAAQAILEGDDACALSVLRACEHLFGTEFMEWEPETFRLEFDELGIEILDENFDGLMAGITLITSPTFFYDANAFENICVAFNDGAAQFDVLHELCPAQIAWGVEQAKLVVDALAEYEIPEELPFEDRFDYEPLGYVAATCKHIGMVTVPDELAFARERVEELSNTDASFISKVKKAWRELDQSKLEEHPFSEDAVGVQLALMATVVLYMKEQREALKCQADLFTESTPSPELPGDPLPSEGTESGKP